MFKIFLNYFNRQFYQMRLKKARKRQMQTTEDIAKFYFSHVYVAITVHLTNQFIAFLWKSSRVYNDVWCDTPL